MEERANLAGVSSAKQPVFWIVAITVACSMLRETATFAIALGRSDRTLLQLCSIP